VDFLSAGRIGQWLEVRAEPVKLGRTLALADARIAADGELIAKAAALFVWSSCRVRRLSRAIRLSICQPN
jgi:acyl-coenzyme A thioesterase PaaI-like protein